MIKRFSLLATAALLALGAVTGAHAQGKTLRLVPHADLKTLDPLFNTAYITRNHGYMVFDMLFAQDSKGQVKPQMVDSWQASEDGKRWSFTLRPGLKFSDGAPVTAEDCGLDPALGQEGHAGPGHVRGRRRAGRHRSGDLHADAQGTLRPGAGGLVQTVRPAALHHAQAHRRHGPEHADHGNGGLRSVPVQTR